MRTGPARSIWSVRGWHLAEDRHLLAASGDLSFEPEHADEATNASARKISAWSKAEASRLDERLLRFFRQYEHTPLAVQNFRIDYPGGLT